MAVSSAAEAGVSSAGKPVAGEAGGRAGRGRGRKGKVPEQRPPSSQHLSQVSVLLSHSSTYHLYTLYTLHVSV